MPFMKHTCIAGLPRKGKTTLALEIVAQLPPPNKILWVNTQAESYLREGPHKNEKAVDVYQKPAPMGKGTDVQEPDFVVWWINMAVEEQLTDYLHDMLLHQRRSKIQVPRTVVIDEAHLFHVLSKYSNLHGSDRRMLTVMTMGPKYNLRLVLTSQRIQDLNPAILRRCERKIFFKLDESDITYLNREGYHFTPITVDYEYVVVE